MTIRVESVGRERSAEALAPIESTMGFELAPEALEQFSQLPEYDLRLVARDGEDVVAGLGSFTFDMTTPGGLVETAGLTGVGVFSTHRRRGLLRRLMRTYLDGVRDRGQPVSALWASEAPIYGRFGYGTASLQGFVELDLRHAAFVAGREAEARVRRVDADEALELFPPIFDSLRAETPGMISRSETWWRVRRLSDPEWSRHGRGPLRRILLEIDGEPAAYALFRQTHSWENSLPGGAVHVNEAIGTSPEAMRAVWRYLCDIDLMERVVGWMLPLDHPLLLLAAEPRRLGFRLADALWVRLVDVEAALAARTYGAGDGIVLELADSFCSWNEGRWGVGPDGVARTSAPADVSLDVSALGSVYLGGFSFAELARAGLAEELRGGGVGRADALFVRVRAPWCPEIF